MIDPLSIEELNQQQKENQQTPGIWYIYTLYIIGKGGYNVFLLFLFFISNLPQKFPLTQLLTVDSPVTVVEDYVMQGTV